MKLSKQEALKLLQLVGMTEQREIDCTEFMHRVAGYLERLGPDGTPPPGYEDVVHHLRLCPECTEEFEALIRALRDDEFA